LPPAVTQALHRLELLFRDPSFIWKFVATVIGIVCVIALIQIVLGTIGRIGLIKGAAEADAGAERLTFGELWRGSTPYFWRILWLTILIGIPIFIVALAIAAGFVLSIIPLTEDNRSDAPVFLVLFFTLCGLLCVVFLLAILVGFVSRQAERAIVLENLPILRGLQRGWEVFTKNLGPILIIWIIQIAIAITASILIALPLLVILVPLIIAFVSNANGANFPFTPWLVAILCVVAAYIPISWLANGILMAYLESVWTLTYLRLTKPKQDSQIPTASPANA
jgi:hypothetical protein